MKKEKEDRGSRGIRQITRRHKLERAALAGLRYHVQASHLVVISRVFFLELHPRASRHGSVLAVQPEAPNFRLESTSSIPLQFTRYRVITEYP